MGDIQPFIERLGLRAAGGARPRATWTATAGGMAECVGSRPSPVPGWGAQRVLATTIRAAAASALG